MYGVSWTGMSHARPMMPLREPFALQICRATSRLVLILSQVQHCSLMLAICEPPSRIHFMTWSLTAHQSVRT